MTQQIIWIDIVGTCNLRCPSCPVGNFEEADFAGPARRQGFMEFDYFRELLAKIYRENASDVCLIELYNWGEPLLHPEIARFVAEVNSYPNMRCGLSTNLSHRRMDLEGALRAGPKRIRVSLSGFNNESHTQTHVRGNVELVKENLRLMRAIIDQYDLNIAVTLAYHVYLHNAGDEIESMRRYCEDLRFIFHPNWANFNPLEKLERYLAGKASPNESQLISKLVIKPEEHLSLARRIDNKECILQDFTTINYDGSVALCCAVYDTSNDIASDFLDVSATVLAQRRRNHLTCHRCIAASYHAMMCGYAMAYKDEIGNKRVRFLDGWELSANRLVRV